MTVKIIFGKPGSGKSYHTVKVLADLLCDWARNEKTSGEPHAQRLFTNLPLNRDKLKDYVERNVSGIDFDVDYYVEPLDDDWFSPPTPKRDERGAAVVDKRGRQVYEYWWDRIPDDTLLVIDEMHKYMGSEYGYVNAIDETTALRNYMAQHRHHRHDWILITQDPSQITAAVLKQAEEVVSVFNAKSTTLPFPISIPGEDIETLLKGFGVNRQIYRVKSGHYLGRRLIFNDNISVFTMSPEIFALYTSNTLAAEKNDIIGDRALPFKTRFGAVLWFTKRHAPHLIFKAAFAIFACVLLFKVVLNLPTILSGASVEQAQRARESFTLESENQAVRTAKNPENLSALPQEAPLQAPINLPEDIAPESLSPNDLPMEKTPSLELTTSHNATSQFAATAFFPDRVISSQGFTYKIGELVEILRDDTDVIEERLERINVKRREILFEGGRIWSRKGFEPPILPPEPIVDASVGNVDLIRDGLPLDGVFSQGPETGADRVRDVANEAN